MIQNVLREIGGIGIYGVISVCLVFIVFTIMLIRVFLLKKPHLEAMGSLPLHEDENVAQSKGENCHE